MGLMKAIGAAAGGVLGDVWLEYFTMDSLPNDVLVTKGRKVINGRSSNTSGSDNLISNGSGIVVAEGQAVALVNNGVIVDFAADPGRYTFNQSTTPSIFADAAALAPNIGLTFADALQRFTYGGGVYQEQRVYYFNIKELVGNKYGTAEPIAYRVVDADIGLDMDVDLRCNGEFSYKMTNPILFYQNVAGNVEGDYTRDMIDSQLKSELLTSLNIALSRISAQGIRYSALPGHAMQIADEINDVLSSKWRDLRGLEVISFAVNSVSITDEDEKRIKDLQAMKSLRDPGMAGAALVAAQADAMRSAAENEGGAAIGFLGLGMASQCGGTASTAAEMISQGNLGSGQANTMNYPVADNGGFAPVPGTAVPGTVPAEQAPSAFEQAPPPSGQPVQTPGFDTAVTSAPDDAWVCPACGQADNHGNFCSNCGTAKPAPASWVCPNCGKTDNHGNFCSNCGTPKP
ncbi:MAG: SPFH domain-containing protein [Coriobacteriia bacterium]|nr:SPFH domain-containing protein [Coriobacteriia bacterium]